MRARTRKCAPAETRMRALRPIRETRSSSLSPGRTPLVQVRVGRRCCGTPHRCDAIIPSDTRGRARGPANGIDATSGTGGVSTLPRFRLEAAKTTSSSAPFGYAPRAPRRRLRVHRWPCYTIGSIGVRRPKRGAPFCSRVGAPNSGRGHRRFSRRRIWRMPGGSRRCACDSAPRFIRSAPLQSLQSDRVWERRRWTLVWCARSRFRPRSDWKRHPCSCRPRVRKRPPHARTRWVRRQRQIWRATRQIRGHPCHSPRPATLAQSALRQLEDFRNGLPRAHFISALRRTPSLLMPPDGERAPASSLSSSEGSAILLAPRASAGAVGPMTRLMRVVDSGDVVQAEPSSGRKQHPSSPSSRNQQWQQKSRLWSAIGRCMTRSAMRSARKRPPESSGSATPRTRWPTPRSAGISRTRARDTRRSSSLARFSSSSTLREARMRRTHAVAAAVAAEPPTVTDDVAARWLQTLASLRAN